MSIKLLGSQVATRRKALGLTQERLAHMAGLSRRTVQNLESGAINDLSFERVSRLLAVLGLTLTSTMEARAH
jgi:transcriptional regulator with XRE-family HTH domain